MTQLATMVVLEEVPGKPMHNQGLRLVDPATLLAQVPAKVIREEPANEPTSMTIMREAVVEQERWDPMQHLVQPELAEQVHYLP